jgi:hypothetical protein
VSPEVDDDVPRLITPEKKFRLVRVIVEEAEDPVFTTRPPGLADKLNP